MKKSFKIMGMAAMVLLLAVSCKKENKDENNGEAKFMTFTAGISQGNGKTYLNGSNLLWSEGDMININGSQFTLTEGGGTNKGEFSGTTEEKGTYYAVYPASGTLSENVATITLPAVQPYDDGSFYMNVAPMVAMTDDSKSFTFTNVCGLLRLDFQSITEPVKKIKLESAKNEYLAGEGTVEITGDGNEVFVLSDKSGNSKAITMEIADGIMGQHQVVFVVPAGAFKTGFNVYFYGNDEDTPFDNITSGIGDGKWEIVAGQMNVVTVNHEVKTQAATIQQDAVTASSLTIPYSIQEACESASIQCADDEEFTINVRTKSIEIGSKAFKEGSVTFDGLSAATAYYVRILVKSVDDPGEIPYCTIVAETLGGPTIPEGALSGVFTINSNGDQVYFSQGNLWYKTTETKFYFENDQLSSTPSTDGSWNTEHISHFFWKKDVSKAVLITNGYNSDSDILFTNDPSDDTKPNENFTVNGIQNKWRTLSFDEWKWLLGPKYDIYNGTQVEANPDTNCRLSSTVGEVANARFARVKVNGKDGLLVFPDDFTWDVTKMGTVPSNINKYDNYGAISEYSSERFAEMETAGCVFLLTAGIRVNKTGVVYYGSGGYWSSSLPLTTSVNAYYLRMLSGEAYPYWMSSSTNALSIRLVCDKE